MTFSHLEKVDGDGPGLLCRTSQKTKCRDLKITNGTQCKGNNQGEDPSTTNQDTCGEGPSTSDGDNERKEEEQQCKAKEGKGQNAD